MYVLVVENETPILMQMRTVLEDLAVPVSFVRGREEALAIANETGAPVVLVTNIDLGRRLDGFNLAYTLRRMAPTMPTLFVSATRWDVVRGIVSKQDYFMLKPFDATIFADKLRNILRQAMAPAAQSRQA